jgi:hypothetical protein
MGEAAEDLIDNPQIHRGGRIGCTDRISAVDKSIARGNASAQRSKARAVSSDVRPTERDPAERL